MAVCSDRQRRRLRHELALGWLTHYAVGIAFAGLLVVMVGHGWVAAPSLLPAVALGIGTVVFPLFLMQPAMGQGVAASRTPAPLRNCLRSVLNHAVFGLGCSFRPASSRRFSRAPGERSNHRASGLPAHLTARERAQFSWVLMMIPNDLPRCCSA